MPGQKKSRLGRKAARSILTEKEREVQNALNKARQERDQACANAATIYRRKLEEISIERVKARKEAQEKYDEIRNAVLKEAFTELA
jgi:F0F1-type ATP synthase membrane subunit b/b'